MVGPGRMGDALALQAVEKGIVNSASKSGHPPPS